MTEIFLVIIYKLRYQKCYKCSQKFLHHIIVIRLLYQRFWVLYSKWKRRTQGINFELYVTALLLTWLWWGPERQTVTLLLKGITLWIDQWRWNSCPISPFMHSCKIYPMYFQKRHWHFMGTILPDWLIDWIMFYFVSAIFQPFNSVYFTRVHPLEWGCEVQWGLVRYSACLAWRGSIAFLTFFKSVFFLSILVLYQVVGSPAKVAAKMLHWLMIDRFCDW